MEHLGMQCLCGQSEGTGWVGRMLRMDAWLYHYGQSGSGGGGLGHDKRSQMRREDYWIVPG